MSQDKKFLPAGAMREVLESKADVSLVRMTVKAGTKPPLHTHSYAQIDYLLKGRADIRLGSNLVRLEAGQSLYIPANVEHGFLLSETDQEFLEIFVPGRQDL
ncbi:cupin domain-containing protein [Eubacteriaceae bacterium ES2]|nr:cupin domain-containing protein [Eubacteriaceae bacterium ES2]